MFNSIRKILPGKMGKSATVIPVVRINGVIGLSAPVRSGLSVGSLANHLDRAFSNKRAPVVALLINSPGGTPVQSHFLYQRIRALAEEHKKEVLVFVEDVAASGGYMVALAGDEIIVNENSMVGSIGVLASGFGFVDAIKKLGIERRIHVAGENKSILDPFLPEKKEDVAYLQSIQQEIHDSFIDLVRSRRKDLLSTEEDLFDGRFWTGTRARSLGLVDEIGEIRTLIKSRFGEDVKFKLIGGDQSFFKRKSGVNFQMDNVVKGLGENLITAAEERLMWSRFGL